MWKLFILSLAALALAEKATYDNYKVYRVFPKTEAQLEIIRQLEQNVDAFSFWTEPSTPGKPADVMVVPHRIPDFIQLLKDNEIPYELYIENVQSLIDNEAPTTASHGDFDFTRYHTLEEIYDYLDQLARANPGKVEVVVGGRTYEGRQIKGVKLSYKKNNPGVFIEGGIHAREWISPATVLFILTQLITSTDPEVRQLAESHDWYVFPSFNPDGFVYTHTTNRLWRKTRRPYGICYGTDPNRNWEYKWMQGGASSMPCMETYAGPAPFSDIETKSLSEYITSISDKFYAYIAFHSYSQYLVFPYGHTRAHLENYDESLAIGRKGVDALAKRYGTQYRTGNIAEVVYIATGSSLDWVKGTFHKPITFLYELRDRGRYGFILPPDQIIPTGQETMDSLLAIFREAKARGHPH